MADDCCVGSLSSGLLLEIRLVRVVDGELGSSPVRQYVSGTLDAKRQSAAARQGDVPHLALTLHQGSASPHLPVIEREREPGRGRLRLGVIHCHDRLEGVAPGRDFIGHAAAALGPQPVVVLLGEDHDRFAGGILVHLDRAGDRRKRLQQRMHRTGQEHRAGQIDLTAGMRGGPVMRLLLEVQVHLAGGAGPLLALESHVGHRVATAVFPVEIDFVEHQCPAAQRRPVSSVAVPVRVGPPFEPMRPVGQPVAVELRVGLLGGIGQNIGRAGLRVPILIGLQFEVVPLVVPHVLDLDQVMVARGDVVIVGHSRPVCPCRRSLSPTRCRGGGRAPLSGRGTGRTSRRCCPGWRPDRRRGASR